MIDLDDEFGVFWRTLWGEARGDDDPATPIHDGDAAVAAVIGNRADFARDWMARTGRPLHPLFGDGTRRSACLRANRNAAGVLVWQFSCWGDSQRAMMEAATDATPGAREAQQVALMALRGELADPTGGAMHYHTRDVAPPWARGRTPCFAFKNHLFYRGIG